MHVSLIAVIIDPLVQYLETFEDTILKNSKYIDEVILVKVDESHNNLIRNWNKGNIKFTLVGHSLLNHIGMPYSWIKMTCGHALGLHRGIELAKNNYLIMSDLDVIFLNKLDEIYLNLINKYDLNIVGVSHFNIIEQSYLDFPCVINCMVKKDTLPNNKWLQNQLHVYTDMKPYPTCHKIFEIPGKYLIGFPQESIKNNFPNPEGIFDAACNLWLWNKERGGKWLSFVLDIWVDSFRDNFGTKNIVYPMNYNLEHYRSNFDLKDDLGNQHLLYHRTGGSREDISSFKKLYKMLNNAMKYI